MDFSIIYVTCRDPSEAESIGRTLVEKRLAAYANIIPKTTALYRWKGKLHEESEAILLVKTRAGLADKVIRAAKSLHSYSNPCILSLPIRDGSKEYLDWVERETG